MTTVSISTQLVGDLGGTHLRLGLVNDEIGRAHV